MQDQSESYYRPDQNLRFKMTTREEERELFRKLKAGDDAAREFLITNHLLFAANVARKQAHGLPENEIVSAANFALMKAIDRFDPERGNRFSTYLRLFIRGEIAQLWRSKNAVRYGNEFPEDLEPGKMPAPLEDDFEEHPVENTDHAEFMKSVLKKCESLLPEKDQKLLRLVYEEGRSFASIARDRGVSREAVRATHARIVKKLATALRRRGVKSL